MSTPSSTGGTPEQVETHHLTTEERIKRYGEFACACELLAADDNLTDQTREWFRKDAAMWRFRQIEILAEPTRTYPLANALQPKPNVSHTDDGLGAARGLKNALLFVAALALAILVWRAL